MIGEWEGRPVLRMPSLPAWRDWLGDQADSSDGVWLAIERAGSPVPSVRWHEAIEHALAFGWVDSTARRVDGVTLLRFTPRNPRSAWGPRNRERAERLIAAGLMTPRGQALIDAARADGRWSAAGQSPTR